MRGMLMDNPIGNFFNSLPRNVFMEPSESGVVFNWSRPGVGFGKITLWNEDGVLHIDTEEMDNEFCLDVLKQVLEEAVDG